MSCLAQKLNKYCSYDIAKRAAEHVYSVLGLPEKIVYESLCSTVRDTLIHIIEPHLLLNIYIYINR